MCETVSKSGYKVEHNKEEQKMNTEVLELPAINLKKMVLGEDCEVVSKSYFDLEGEEYQNEEAFYAYQLLKELEGNITGDLLLISTPDMFNSQYGYGVGRTVELDYAKLCGFGVVRMMIGKNLNKYFVVPIKNFDISLQLFAYNLLANGKSITRVIVLVRYYLMDEYGKKYLRIIWGDVVFEMVLKKML